MTRRGTVALLALVGLTGGTVTAGAGVAGADPGLARFHQQQVAWHGCQIGPADELPYATTRNTARDMDVIRAALGEEKLSYLGYSYGTYLGAVYTQMFPGRAGRIVLDSAVNPDTYGPRLLIENAPAVATALAQWAGWAARHDAQYGLGNTGERVLATVDRISRVAAQHPLRVGRYAVDAHLVAPLLFAGVYDDRDEPSADLAATVRVLKQAATGATATPTPSLEETLTFLLTRTESSYGSGQISILCGDRAAPRNPQVYWRDIQAHRDSQPLFGPLTMNISPCAFWPNPPREQPTRLDNNVPALIVQSTGDPATLYESGLAMRQALSGSRLVTLRGARIHAVYANYGNACVDGQVNAYLRGGVLPAQDRTCS